MPLPPTNQLDTDGAAREAHAGSLALTRSQLQIWIERRLHAGLPLHNIVHTAAPAGPIDEACFQSAFQALLEDTDALRTVIAEEGGIPRQRVLPAPAAELELIDLAARERPHAALAEWLKERRARPLDPATRCFDSALLRLAPGRCAWYLNVHHIVSDGWSTQLLMQRMGDLYEKARQGALRGRPAPPRYQDCVREQLRREESRAALADRQYWEEKLAAAPAAASLYGRAPFPAGIDMVCELRRLGRARTRRLEALAADPRLRARSRDQALATLLLAAFALFLRKVSGAPEISVGVPLMNRRSAAERATAGLFMCVLPLKIAIEPRDTFLSLFQRIAERQQDAAAHRLHVPGNHHGHVFQVDFNFHNTAHPPLCGWPTRHKWFRTDHAMALSLQVRGTRSQGLLLQCDFSAELFSAAERERATRHYLNAIDALLDDPARPVEGVNLLERREMALLDGFQRGPALPLAQDCLSSLFALQARQRPQAPALLDGDGGVTYAELERKSLRIAARLARLGLRPEDRVGLFLERSVDQVAALLAVLAAGGCFVPLDPAYPEERLRWMAEDAGVRAIITREGLCSRLPAGQALLLFADDPSLAGEAPAAAPPAPARLDSAVYLLHTSGSTGRPKGVLGTQRGVVNRLRWMWSAYPLQPGEVCCLKTSLSFVDSVWEVLGPLLQGVPALVIPEEEARDARLLVAALARHRVTRITLVPSLLASMLALFEDLGARLPDLRVWTSSGEALPSELAARFHERVPGRVLLNLYGSSEVAADVTCHEVRPETLVAGARVPAGRPIANTTIRVLDEAGLPAPLGVPGEVSVSGAGLARGYHERPEDTARRFVEHVADAGTPERLFRSGDIGRWRADGLLELLGRQDAQVKIRGQRVEPAEVEAALRRDPAVREAAVGARLREDGAAELVACVVPADPAAFSARDLRAELLRLLPSFMVPAAVLRVRALPRLPNGKLDRLSLPLAAAGSEAERRAAPPENAEQRALLAVFERFLDARPLGVEDSFFELGGDSIAAVEALAEMEKALGRQISLEILFRHETARGIARALLGEEGAAAESGSCVVPLRRSGTLPPFFCVPAAASSASPLALLARHLGPDQPFFAFCHRGLADGEKPHSRVEEMAQHYIGGMKTVQAQGPYRIGGRCFGGLVAFEMARQLCARGEEVARLVVLDTLRPPGVAAPRGTGPRAWLARRLRGAGKAWQALLHEEGEGDASPGSRRQEEVRRAHVRARNRYGSAVYPGKVVLFRSGQRGQVSYVQGRWSECALEGVESHVFRCAHEELLREPVIREVARRLASVLA
ncbi:MAG: amino acid adenylation domain-containing protein [Planctomycetes bacterium]|nr:amino acid adenylation domain-containing protein [Planctomycetota bacterium]